MANMWLMMMVHDGECCGHGFPARKMGVSQELDAFC